LIRTRDRPFLSRPDRRCAHFVRDNFCWQWLRDAAAVNAPHSLPTMASDDIDEPGLLSEPLMRAEQVAELLAIKTSTVYELSRRQRDRCPRSVGR
jgi:hypothetical protein